MRLKNILFTILLAALFFSGYGVIAIGLGWAVEMAVRERLNRTLH